MGKCSHTNLKSKEIPNELPEESNHDIPVAENQTTNTENIFFIIYISFIDTSYNTLTTKLPK